jgi:hypothetical protein
MSDSLDFISYGSTCESIGVSNASNIVGYQSMKSSIYTDAASV